MSVSPIFMPEVGQTFSWAMCRNTMCQNYGIAYEGPMIIPEQTTASDSRYRLYVKDVRDRPRLTCKYCGQSFQLHSNRAVYPVMRYFLGLSLPFADCPNPDCENHGHNVFEHYATSGPNERRRYRCRSDDHKVACRKCQKSFGLGEAVGLSRKNATYRSVKSLLEYIRVGLTLTQTIELTKMKIGTYYRRMLIIGRQLRDYQAYRNAYLQHPKFANQQSTVQVYTDVIQVSLQSYRDQSRFKFLNFIVSVVRLEKTYHILAVHPCFMPDELCPSLYERMTENENFSLSRWDSLELPEKGNIKLSRKDTLQKMSDTSRAGLFIRSPFYEAAHFIVVQKMLSRFQKIHYYMDGDKPQYNAALVALRAPILAGRVEIALFQHNKENLKKAKLKTDEGTKRSDKLKAALKSEWQAMENRLKEECNFKDLFPGSTVKIDPKRLAMLFHRSLFKGAYPEDPDNTAHWAWLHFPLDLATYRDCRTFWLTRMQHQTLKDGEELLQASSLYSVDSAINTMRTWVASLKRPSFRATPGRSYRDSYQDPAVVCSELWVSLFFRNFHLREKTEQKHIPARSFGLLKSNENTPVASKKLWQWRLGVKQAKRMSQWYYQ